MSDPSDLSNLHDIVMPPTVSSWPPAPGWLILGAASLAVAGVVAAMAIAAFRRNAYRREALVALNGIDCEADPAAALKISTILKRAALAAYPRREVAQLSGPAWLAFLDRTGRMEAFTQGDASALSALAFGGDGQGAPATIVAKAKHWIRVHRRDKARDS